MFKQSKIKSNTKISINRRSKRSIKSDNLFLSTSHDNNRINSARKSKCVFSTIPSTTSTKSYKSYAMPEKAQLIARTPKNVAVHFGNFYALQSNMGEACYNRPDNFCEGTAAIEGTRRSRFTRQMVYRLERATDTEDYARQVSILLKETVEPPNFRLNSLLSENSIPNGSRGIMDYPLWYKEPHEIPLAFSNPIAQPNA